MKFLSYGLLIFSCAVVAFGALSRERTEGVFDGICRPKVYNIAPFPVNEVRQVPGLCMSASCESSGEIVYASCGVIGGKLVKGDKSLPYPDCCDRPA